MAKPKILAFYLPQYHAIPENDEWWGKGFTEWTNVRKAKPIFLNHNQPRVPLNDNYYNLLEPETFSWQVELAQKYGVDGFCFYHYWFDGKLLLEKPLENYLKRPDLNMNYCFSWANEPWARTWDGLNSNVLMPQNYNGMEDIEAHFNYMLPFFKDERYIKIDNKPLFVIYKTSSITYFGTMVKKWKALAKENGFDGIYFVETLGGASREKYSPSTSAVVYMEPMFVVEEKNVFRKIKAIYRNPITRNRRISYSYLWRKVLRKERLNCVNWPGAFCDWDNSARKKTKNLVLTGTSVKKFEKYFSNLYEKAEKMQSPYIFINAWNEWAEGTYLEPDTKNKYGYLEAIKKIKDR